eukprot:gene15795-biopygen9744
MPFWIPYRYCGRFTVPPPRTPRRGAPAPATPLPFPDRRAPRARGARAVRGARGARTVRVSGGGEERGERAGRPKPYRSKGACCPAGDGGAQPHPTPPRGGGGGGGLISTPPQPPAREVL